jgi:predicted CXXCH cytochrome family protein
MEAKKKQVGKLIYGLLGITAFLAILLFAPADQSQAAIDGSVHDFEGVGGATQICGVCHTPHNGNQAVANAPLWDHTLTSATYTIYSQAATDATMPAGTGITGISRLCLSCHDGSVAVTGTTFINSIDPTANVGLDLSNDHPIGFTYNTALAGVDLELEDPATKVSGLAGGGFITGDLLFSDILECASCHDVHNGGNAPTNTKLLRLSLTGSALCLTCHKK